MVRLCVRIPRELHLKIKLLAKTAGKTMSQFVAETLAEKLSRPEKLTRRTILMTGQSYLKIKEISKTTGKSINQIIREIISQQLRAVEKTRCLHVPKPQDRRTRLVDCKHYALCPEFFRRTLPKLPRPSTGRRVQEVSSWEDDGGSWLDEIPGEFDMK